MINNIRRVRHAVVAMALLGSNVTGQLQASAAETVTYPERTNEIMHGNPHTGMIFEPNWSFTDQGITDLINQRPIPSDVDIVQIYFGWKDIEPEDDQWDFARLDAAFAGVVAQGKKVVFRLDFSEGDETRDTYLPTWLWTEYNIPNREIAGNPLYLQAQYCNASFLSELDEAIKKVGERYDGDPNLMYVDLNAVGRAGEWGGWDNADHFDWSVCDANEFGQTVRERQRNTLTAIVDSFSDAFPTTRLMVEDAGQFVDGPSGDPNNPSDEVTNEQRAYHWAFDYQLDGHPDWGIRSNTVFALADWNLYVNDFTPWLMKRSWLEGHMVAYEGSSWNSQPFMLVNKQRYIDNALGIHTNIGTFNNAGYNWPDMMAEWNGYFHQLARNVGYRFVLAKAQYNDPVQPSGAFRLDQTWLNEGVGRLPEQHDLKVYFVDPANGNVVWSGTDASFDQTLWLKWNVYGHGSSFVLPSSVPPGTYDLKIAMVDDAGEPAIAMPLANGTNRMYKIGTITVAASADPYTAPQPGGSVKVEAEDFHSQSGTVSHPPEVDSDPTPGFRMLRNCSAEVKDCIGYSDTGDWAKYIRIPFATSGEYVLDMRLATGLANQSFRIEVNGTDVTGVVTAPNTNGAYTELTRRVQVPAGLHEVKLTVVNGGRSMNFDWLKFTKADPDDVMVQAESFTSKSSAPLLMTIADVDGTDGIGYIQSGEWLSYANITVPESGDYLAQFRIATTSATQSFKLEVDGTDITGTVVAPNTGGHDRWSTVSVPVALTAGSHTLKLTFVHAGGGINVNWMKFLKQAPFAKRIEAEAYTRPSADPVNGQTNILLMTIADGAATDGLGYIHTGDYVDYDSIYIPHEGIYQANFRVQTSATQSFRMEVDGLDVSGDIAVPNTNSAWTTVSRTVQLPEGNHKIRIYFTDAGGNINMNWFSLTTP